MDYHHGDEDSGTSWTSTNTRTTEDVAKSIESDVSLRPKIEIPSTSLHDNDIAQNVSAGSEDGYEGSKPRVRYRVEYRYLDGELAYEREGDDETKLLRGHQRRFEALPPITITTVYTSRITKERSRKKKHEETDDKKDKTSNDKTKNDTGLSRREVTRETFGNKDEVLPEDFANSHASKKLMTIHSKYLLNVLRDVVKFYPGFTFLGNEFEVREPYRVLCHHMNELGAYEHPHWHDEAYRTKCTEHLDILLTLLNNTYGKAIKDEKDRWARKIPVCTFEYLWLLFKPGEICYLENVFGINPYVVQLVADEGGIVQNKATRYEIDHWKIDYDGYEMGRSNYTFTIAPFDGEREIKSLKFYPTRFYKESQEKNHKGKTFRERLIARGKSFWALPKEDGNYRVYDGESTSYPYKKIQSRIVIDPVAYFNRSTFERSDRGSNEARPTVEGESNAEEGQQFSSVGCQCQSCTEHPGKVRRGKFEGFSGLYPDEDEPPEDEDFFFLCSFRTFAFILKDRTWDSIHVDKISEVTETISAFDQLVLPNEVKHTLRAISCSYVKAKENSRAKSTDIIKGKGEGKIFLLHGPPGTGKTLSAEVVAELTKRPLLSLTCGDLGTTAGEVESRLGRYMYLGEMWGAVVLLDEADIYLEARAINEVKRNSLVSVFLRALEYYNGLLFLTTNRVNTFDEAFKSRIHVAIEYKRLTNKYRQIIWEKNIDRLLNHRVSVSDKARDYAYFDEEVLGLEWNGREIRNALQTAMSLAEYESEEKGQDSVRIKRTHLERVVKLSGSFQEYIASMHRGRTDSYVAKKKQLRNDFYHEEHTQRPEKNTIGKLKNLRPQDDEETPMVNGARSGRKFRDEEEDEEEEPKLRTRKCNAQRTRTGIPEDEDELPRSRSKQSTQRSRLRAPREEEESEEDLPKPRSKQPKQRSRHAVPMEEEESEEVTPATKPKRTTKRATNLEEEEESEEVAPTTKPKRTTKRAIHPEEEEEEE
ncbi:MAG: hypothetical protein Q9209_000363 [Squamulea sp. 1 TL-2023]